MSVFISHFGWLHYNGHLRVREIWTNFLIILSHRLMKKQTKTTVYMHRNVMNLEWYLQWEKKKVQKITTFHAHEVMWEWQPLYALTRCNHKKKPHKHPEKSIIIQSNLKLNMHPLAMALIWKFFFIQETFWLQPHKHNIYDFVPLLCAIMQLYNS